MLSGKLPAIGVRGFALTEEPSGSAPALELLGRALDQTLAEVAPAGDVGLLLFSGFAFSGPRADAPWPGAESALLDNELSATISRDVLNARGLAAVQPHGVWLVEQLPLTSALRVARGFMLGEGLARVLVVTCDGGWSGTRGPTCAASCLLSLDVASGVRLGSARERGPASDPPDPDLTLIASRESWAARVRELARWMHAPFDVEQPTCELTEGDGDLWRTAAFERDAVVVPSLRAGSPWQ
ncbi:MAG: hypothetical protein RJA70_1516 [Pseudomonadota bacterium]|jgi:hypothetical protein